MAKHNAH